MKLQESVSASDGQGAIQAQEMLYDAKQKMEALSNIKRQATHNNSQPKQNISVPDPIVQRYVTDWMEENPWYDPTGKNEESQITQIIDKKLTEEGYDPSSPDYWDELTYRVKKRLPEVSNRAYNESNVRNQRPRSVVTSSGRESSASPRGNQYVLTPDRVSAMKEAGVWDNPDARKRATQRYMEWDRQNKDRK